MLTRLAILAAVLSLMGCFGGRVSEDDRVRISDVQAAYDAEFRAAIATGGLTAGEAQFDRTLGLIAQDQGDAGPAVDALYTLLEGLIYLQTGQLGKARLSAPDVAAATGALKSNAIEPRNVVLASHFDDLITGRSAEETLDSLTGDSEPENRQRLAVAAQIADGADRATRKLCRAGGADDGTAFVAAYQASFLVQADRATSRACLPFPVDSAACAAFLDSRQDLVTARNLMSAFPGSFGTTSQVAATLREIETNLRQSQDGAPLGPPQDPCG